jgi:BirA family biotin operon repressor/biotin-[acetyl-CoA-carboxylase] ligase
VGRAAFAGFSLRQLVRVPSTQDVVRAAARAGAAEGLCCVAAEQSAGRGRQGRRWSAPRGSALLASVLLRRGAPTLPGIPIAAGLAVAEALARWIPGDPTDGGGVRLKWPNDVLAGGAKLAGILVETCRSPGTTDTAVILGFGVNLTVGTFPPDARGVSLSTLCDGEVPSWDIVLAAVLTTLSERLVRLDGDGGLPALLTAWRAWAAGLGEPMEADTPTGRISGIASGIDDDGALLLDTSDGTIRLLAGDVHIGMPPGITSTTVPPTS